MLETFVDREVAVHDPLLDEYDSDLIEAVKDAEGVILMVDHDEYKDLPIETLLSSMSGNFILDTRNFVNGTRWEKHHGAVKTLGSTTSPTL